MKSLHGFPSIAAYRRFLRQERLQKVAEEITKLQAGEALRQKKREEHYLPWIAECCIEPFPLPSGIVIQLEGTTTELYQSYRSWCAKNGIYARAKQAWGRWMATRYQKIPRNSGIAGRVYLGISLKPAGWVDPPAPAIAPEEAPDPVERPRDGGYEL
jgi:hypothetical protein